MNFPAPTRVGRLHAESRYLPATHGVGGDIHDVIATSFGVRLLLGDVMGSGDEAYRTGLSVLSAWRQLAGTEPSLPGLAVRLHGLIARSEHPERFVTALVAGFPDPGWAELVCCGHPPPLLLRGGSAMFTEPYAAPPLGLLDLADGWCRTSMIPVGDGDGLLLYTDGVSEARDAAGRFFPLAQATTEALRTDGPPLLDTLMARLEDHIGPRRSDDALLLLVTMR
jgi:serine phosphatase RsbU (regulator of sigma subunit)